MAQHSNSCFLADESIVGFCGIACNASQFCGVGVLVQRTVSEQQDAVIARILYFFEKHWEELLKFSRRTNRQLERWAARYGYKETPKELMDHAQIYHYGRYTCVNLTNTEPVEIRIFRGTLKYN